MTVAIGILCFVLGLVVGSGGLFVFLYLKALRDAREQRAFQLEMLRRIGESNAMVKEELN